MKKGRLIVVESLGDNYGKTTICKELESKLTNATTYSFPSELTPMGIFINRMLVTREIDLLKTDQEFLASIYMYDFKMVYDKYIKSDLDSGKDVILDRYYFSTLVYQTAINELQGNDDREVFYNNTLRFATEYLELPKADLNILLVDPHKAALEMKNKNDQFESSKDLQELVYNLGIETALDEHFEDVLYIKITNDKGIRNTSEHNVEIIMNNLMKHGV